MLRALFGELLGDRSDEVGELLEPALRYVQRTPFTRFVRGSTAAPTISGPAQAPRPTSSTPTTTSQPSSHRACSIRRVGATFFDGAF